MERLEEIKERREDFENWSWIIMDEIHRICRS
jgi:superfamily II DNA or RNA helicase